MRTVRPSFESNHELMKNQLLLTLLFSIVVTFNSHGKVILPAVFSNHMVLQQNSEVAVWGWAAPAEIIKMVGSWAPDDTVVVKTDNTSRWQSRIKTMAADGKAHTLTVLGSNNRVVLSDVLLGEVWLCSGQSNMEMKPNQYGGIMDAKEEIAAANHSNIRFLDVPKIGADFPQEDIKSNWTVCTPQTMSSTSAAAYFFGRELHQQLDVPVGLIVSAWGGTPAEVWVREELIEGDSILNTWKYDDHYDWWPGDPGTAYNGMIAPLIPYGIAGAIWYQGESNRKYPHHYARLMKTLIESWRARFGHEFPFYFVQITPFNYGNDGESWIVREQQELTTKIVPRTGMVVVPDLVDDLSNIHPANKQDVGKRLANLALAETYHIDMGLYKSPTFKSMERNKNKLTISFNDAGDELKSTRKHPSGFLIAGADKEFLPAKAIIKGNKVVLTSKEVKDPVAVRFCFDDNSIPDIFNSAGLPVAPFRTDNWNTN